MKQILCIFYLLFSLSVYPQQATNYAAYLEQGQTLYNQKKYTLAKKHFTVMLNKFISHKNEINGWIAKCDAATKEEKPNESARIKEKNSEKFTGKKVEVYDSGAQYEGDFVNGIRQGEGTYTWADGKKYVGQFKNGDSHGHGTLTWPDGRKYVGEWQNDKKNGYGTYTWPNGAKYVGQFKNNARNGQGTHTYSDGTTFTGQWKDDNPVQ